MPRKVRSERFISPRCLSTGNTHTPLAKAECRPWKRENSRVPPSARTRPAAMTCFRFRRVLFFFFWIRFARKIANPLFTAAASPLPPPPKKKRPSLSAKTPSGRFIRIDPGEESWRNFKYRRVDKKNSGIIYARRYEINRLKTRTLMNKGNWLTLQRLFPQVIR